MAFSVDYNSPEGELCPICRRVFHKGNIIRADAYRAEYSVMCESCYKHCFHRVPKRSAALIEDSANLPILLRPAQRMEKPRSGGKKTAHGYEYAMPHATGQQIFNDFVIWLFMCLAAWLFLQFADAEHKAFISRTALNLMILSGSCLWAVRNLWLLIKGFFCGMGWKRMLLLIATLPVNGYLAYVSVQLITHGF